MAYAKQDWNDGEAGGTPLSAARLNHMEDGIDDADERLAAHEADTSSVHGIADTSVLETTTGSQAKVDAHEADTTSVHGIADTAALRLKHERFGQVSGSKGATLDRMGQTAVPVNVLVSGRLHLFAIYLRAGELLTSASFVSGVTAAGTPTNQWFALYDSSLNLLRQTTDDTTTAWAADALKTLNLTSTFNTTYSGLHYLGVMVAASTVPTLRGANQATGISSLPPLVSGHSTTGLTTTAPNPAAALTAADFIAFAYVS